MENKWEDSYLLNINSIDEQHRAFFELCNKEINQVNSQDKDQLTLLLEKLTDYLKSHFKHEEELLKKSDYKDLENHISQHKFFIQKVDSLKKELDYNNPLISEKITSFMKKWFLSHIIKSDRQYKETVTNYLRDK